MTIGSSFPKMSVEEYFKLDQTSMEAKYEFIDGNVYLLAGGTADHSSINGNIITALKNALKKSQCKVHGSDLKVRLSENRFVFPDISVSCDPRDRGKITTMQFPTLVVETLSPGTEAYDRKKKFSYYRACTTIQEYVLVDTQAPLVEVYRRDQSPFWKYSAFETGDLVELASLDVTIPISTIYEDIEFSNAT